VFVRILRKSIIKIFLTFSWRKSSAILLTAYIVITDNKKERTVILKELANVIDFTILISEILWGEKIYIVSFIFDIEKFDAIVGLRCLEPIKN
jgi:hypothetical protein